MTVKDIMRYLDKFGPKGPEEILLFGDINQEVSGIAVCWMPTLEVMEKAASEGCNLIICHENLTFPYNFYIFGRHLETTLAWKANRERLAFLARKNMAVIRAHATLDRAYIANRFYEAAGLGAADGAKRTGNIAAIGGISLEELALRLKEKLRLDRVRVTGNPDRIIKKAGVAPGGLGLSVNMSFLQGLVDEQVDCIITGEADEESLRFAEDSGVCFLETSHIACESMGLAEFKEDLQNDFPDLRVRMIDAGVPWRYV
ncbi:MAG: Nif3-like dinuclear metal center hexameric protein [Bacillota bacterium]